MDAEPRLRIVALALALAGCDAPTSLAVHLDVEPGFAPVSQFAEVSIPSSGVTATQSLDPAARAFTVLLPDAALDVTVRVNAADAGGGQVMGSLTATSIPHQRVDRTLCLGDCGAPADGAAPDLASDALTPNDSAIQDLAHAPPDLTVVPCSGPSKCAGAGTALCTGFESGALDAPFASRVDPGGALAFDTARVCRGASSLHLTTAAVSGAQQIATYVFESMVKPTSTLYVRAFVWLPQQTAAATRPLIFAFQNASPYAGVELHVETNNVLQQVTSCGASVVSSGKSPQPFPTNRWVCVEWEIVSAADMTGALHTSLDGQLVSSVELTGVVTQPSPPLDAVAIGIDVITPGAQGPLDVWLDELAIDTQPIGCLK